MGCRRPSSRSRRSRWAISATRPPSPKTFARRNWCFRHASRSVSSSSPVRGVAERTGQSSGIKTRNSKHETGADVPLRFVISSLDFELVSNFVLRISNFFPSCHPQAVLVDVYFTAAEELGAVDKVFHVHLVCLVPCHFDRLRLVLREVLRPAVERPRVVESQALQVHQLEPAGPRHLEHPFGGRHVAAGEDL